MAKMVPMKERVKNFYFKLFDEKEKEKYDGRPVEKCIPEIYRELIGKGLFDYMIDRVGEDSVTYRMFIEESERSIRDAMGVILHSFEEELEKIKNVIIDYNPRKDKGDIEPILKLYNIFTMNIQLLSKSFDYDGILINNLEDFKREFDLLQQECTTVLLLETIYKVQFRFLWHDLQITLINGLFEQSFSLITDTLEADGMIKWNEVEDDFVFIN